MKKIKLYGDIKTMEKGMWTSYGYQYSMVFYIKKNNEKHYIWTTCNSFSSLKDTYKYMKNEIISRYEKKGIYLI